MKISKLIKKILLIALIILTVPIQVNAQDYQFYFFGINLKSFQNNNWLELTAGAITSILIHELGHALYLQTQGKNWNFQTSSSCFSIHTSDFLSKSQSRNFGRAGFVLQMGIGSILTTFDKTKYSDFTKGWVGINALQICSYKIRHHDDGFSDFDRINKSDGNANLELGIFYLMGSYNLLKLERELSTR